MVFGVCVLGVGALYLVPGLARSPVQVAGPVRTNQGDPTRPTLTRVSSPAAAPPPVTAVRRPRLAAAAPLECTGDDGLPAPVDRIRSRRRSSRSRPGSRHRRGAGTRARPRSSPAAPSTRSRRARSKVEMTEATGRADARLVRGNRQRPAARLPGLARRVPGSHHIATTATIAWFNDDADQHVVQVRALDTAGNQSALPATVLVPPPGARQPRPARRSRAQQPPSPTGTPTTPAPRRADLPRPRHRR